MQWLNKLIGALLLLLTLGWAGVSQAENLFMWRAEGTTLSGTDDNPGTDTSATASGTPAINGTAALVGSNGIQVDSAGDHYRLDAETAVINRLTGSIGFRVRIQTWGASASLFHVRGSSYTYAIYIRMQGTDELRLQINEDSNVSTLDTTAANLATDTTYFITASWDQPNNARRIRVYDSNDTLLHTTEDTATAYTAPVDLVTSDGMRFGDTTGTSTAYYLDNIFIDDTYAGADEILCNRSITAFSAYAACGGGGAETDGFRLRLLQ